MPKSAELAEMLEKIEAERDTIRGRLTEQRDQLIDQIRHLSQSSLVSSRQAGEELADVGGDDFMREVELALVGEEEKIFRLIQEALQRLESGKYGVCVDCAGPISSGRLKAIPYAKLCVECKGYREEHNGLPPEDVMEEVEELVE